MKGTSVRARKCSIAALALLSTLAVTPAAHSDASTAPQLLDVQLSETAATVSGLEWHDVVVRLHLTSPIGIAPTTDTEGSTYPSVRFDRTGAGRGQVQVAPDGPAFTLASGTAQDGWWQGLVHVTAGYDGTFTVTHVWAMQSDFTAVLSVDPRTIGINAQLQVTGVNIPHVTIKQAPDPVVNGSSLTLSGTVTGVDTGLPFAGVTVGVRVDTACIGSPTGPGSPTAADGSWHQAFPKWDASELNCAFIAAAHNPSATDNGIAEYVGLFNIDPDFHEWISAQLASGTVRAGGAVAVTGKSSAIREPLILQRLVRSTWRTVGTSTVRLSGRFTLVAQPPSRGTWRYRVLRVPTRHNEFPASSSVRILVAT
ncbi:MAG: hypothetical protein QOH99_1771 [Frankiaceae bacterium]|nr:hypothetical protein [Frankiaceae bacterium]